MAEKVKLSKDGNSIDFVQSDSLPTSLKKFRQSPEIEGFYRFIFENDLQKEAYEILDRIVAARKAAKKAQKTESKQAAKAEAQAIAAHEKQTKLAATEKAKVKTPVAPVKTMAKPVAPKTVPVKVAAKPTAKPVIKGKVVAKAVPTVKKKTKK